MRNVIYIVFMILISLCFSCVGQKEDIVVTDLQLIVDRNIVSLDNNEQVVFTVYFNGVDVTDESLIYDVTDAVPVELDDSTFIPRNTGIYQFLACYQGMDTQVIEIQVVQDNIGVEGDFLRKFLIMKFTATWCVNCPKMSDAIKTLKKDNPNQIVDISIHHLDELQVEAAKQLVEHFNVSAIPVAVVDFDKSRQTSISSSTLLSNLIKEVESNSLKACGIKIQTSKDNDSLNVDVTCILKEEGHYKMAVAIVQDNIEKAQTGAGTDYIHNGVLKDVLHESMEGDELGVCNPNQIISKQYTYPLNLLEEEGKYRVISYVLNKQDKDEYVVNNVTVCDLYESIDYIYK